MDENYYIPVTLEEMIEKLQKSIRMSNELTGKELIVGAQYIDEDDYNVPSGSIVFLVQQNTLDPDDPKYGTITIMPGTSKQLM